MKKVVSIIVFIAVSLIIILNMMCLSCKAQTNTKEIIVANKDFTEQYIAGQLMKQLLENRGFTVELRSGRTSICLRECMGFNDIDVCSEYTGTGWMVHLAHEYTPGIDSNEIYEMVKKEDEANGFIWLDPIWNNNTFALASWPEFADQYGLKTLSDLAALYREKEGEIKTCVGLEFSTRPDGLPGLQQHYDFIVEQSNIIVAALEIPQESLMNNDSDVAMVFGTDAVIRERVSP